VIEERRRDLPSSDVRLGEENSRAKPEDEVDFAENVALRLRSIRLAKDQVHAPTVD
jgi:hypothetical protein